MLQKQGFIVTSFFFSLQAATFATVNLNQTEIQLKKRWSSAYHWGRKQADIWDTQTNFIYGIAEFDEVVDKVFNTFSTHSKYVDLRNYALNRWYNFQSAKAVEYIFNTHPKVRKVSNAQDREKDFYINGLAFDHKTSVYPRGFGHTLDFALNNPKELAKWLYINQSEEQRFHTENRLFLVLYNKGGDHWRLKAELEWIKLRIDNYLENYEECSLIDLKHSSGVSKTDIIFGVR